MNKHLKMAISQVLGYQFKDESLLTAALTHKSLLGKQSIGGHGYNNERLEFLGDSVLALASSSYLYVNLPNLQEGDLSRLRAQYICQEHLSECAKKIDLSRFILSDKAMRSSGSTNSKAVLSDALEAIFGAIYLDGGLEEAKAAILRILGVPKSNVALRDKDAKTKLQEIVQANTNSAPKYRVLQSSGPAHAPQFLVSVSIDGKIIAKALGDNKKSAEQNAASLALVSLNKEKDSGGSGTC